MRRIPSACVMGFMGLALISCPSKIRSDPWGPTPTKTPLPPVTVIKPPAPWPTNIQKRPTATRTRTAELPAEPAPTQPAAGGATQTPAAGTSPLPESKDVRQSNERPAPVPTRTLSASDAEMYRREEQVAGQERANYTHDQLYFQRTLLFKLQNKYPNARFVAGRDFSIMTTVNGTRFPIYLADPLAAWQESADPNGVVEETVDQMVKTIGEALALEP